MEDEEESSFIFDVSHYVVYYNLFMIIFLTIHISYKYLMAMKELKKEDGKLVLSKNINSIYM